jgi:thiamine-monophosphate kinase
VTGEFELIDQIRRRLGRRGERVLRGAGDDASVVRADGVVITSVDAFVEGVHFRLATTSLRDLGHKCLAASLSDLAAVGAEAGEAYLALGLPPNIGEREVLELVDGAEALAEEVGATICGGDISGSNELFVVVTVVGHAASEQELLGRAGAQPGEVLGVTGRLGGAQAGLLLLERKEHGVPIDVGERLMERQRRPRPLLAPGRAIAAAGASAMLDVSDGVASDAARLAEESGVAVEVDLTSLPLDDGVEAVAELVGVTPEPLGAGGGEDYELLFTAHPDRREQIAAAASSAGSGVTWIGRTGAGSGVSLLDRRGVPRQIAGWDHIAAHGGRSGRRSRRA